MHETETYLPIDLTRKTYDNIRPEMNVTANAYTPPIPYTSRFLTGLITQLSSFNNPTDGHDEDLDNTELSHRKQGQEKIRDNNTLSRLSPFDLPKAKSLMLTLHCIYPNELLLALDILDRRLVKKVIVRKQDESDSDSEHVITGATAQAAAAAAGGGHATQRNRHFQHIESALLSKQVGKEEIFFVRSMSLLTARGGGPSPLRSYEVRLSSWNCTCPAFALSAFQDLEGEIADEDVTTTTTTSIYPPDTDSSWFGGTLTRSPSRSSAPACKHLLACILGSRCPTLFGSGVEETCVVKPVQLAGWCAGWAN